MKTIVLLVATLLLQAQGQAPPPPNPNAGPRPAENPNAARCNNYFRTANAQKCTCNKAMNCDGDSDGTPNGMASWCSNQCKKGKCDCISPCVTKAGHSAPVDKMPAAKMPDRKMPMKCAMGMGS